MATKPADDASSVMTKIRVLVAHLVHLPNHVVSLPPKEADAAVKAGWADDHPDAVAYAEANEPQPEAAPAEKLEA